jgi:hypothetical protein
MHLFLEQAERPWQNTHHHIGPHRESWESLQSTFLLHYHIYFSNIRLLGQMVRA